MASSTNNLEAVARDICAKQLARHGGRDAEHAANVDRYWHCVAAELEAGLIDDAGNPTNTVYPCFTRKRPVPARLEEGKPFRPIQCQRIWGHLRNYPAFGLSGFFLSKTQRLKWEYDGEWPGAN